MYIEVPGAYSCLMAWVKPAVMSTAVAHPRRVVSHVAMARARPLFHQLLEWMLESGVHAERCPGEAPNQTPVHGPVGSTFVANPGAWHQDGADEPRREASR